MILLKEIKMMRRLHAVIGKKQVAFHVWRNALYSVRKGMVGSQVRLPATGRESSVRVLAKTIVGPAEDRNLTEGAMDPDHTV